MLELLYAFYPACCRLLGRGKSDNPSFDNLPHDVLVIIADHANSPKDLRLVSKEFCAAVGEAAVSLKPSQDLQASQLLAVSSAFLKATALDVSHWHSLTSTIFLNLKILFPDLIELHLPGSCLSEAGPGLFSAFPQLRKLVLSDPHGMMGDQLPSCICKVWTSSLQCLHLQECSQLEELTLEINRLKNLRELCISDCHGLLALRQGAGGLTSLHTLSVVRCFSLREFSDSVWGMTSLQRLCVDDCPLLDLPETVSGLVGLRDLEVQNCSQISSLPEEVADLALLQVLSLSGCSNLTNLPSGFSKLKHLRALDISGCSSLAAMPPGYARMRAQLSVTGGWAVARRAHRPNWWAMVWCGAVVAVVLSDVRILVWVGGGLVIGAAARIAALKLWAY